MCTLFFQRYKMTSIDPHLRHHVRIFIKINTSISWSTCSTIEWCGIEKVEMQSFRKFESTPSVLNLEKPEQHLPILFVFVHNIINHSFFDSAGTFYFPTFQKRCCFLLQLISGNLLQFPLKSVTITENLLQFLRNLLQFTLKSVTIKRFCYKFP